MYKNRITPKEIKSLPSNAIIVFGSNAQGNHAGGLAAYCKKHFKAKEGVSRGITGQCYAIDTMSGFDVIKEQIDPFIQMAKSQPEKTFLVTLIGCGIAGYVPEQMAPLFKAAREVANIHFPSEFWPFLSVKGYKIFNGDFTCRGMQYEVGKNYIHPGKINICNEGLHFCLKASDCFSYYSFDPNNIVCEVEAIGDVQYHEQDSKACTNDLKIVRKLEWSEVLAVANQGSSNTGHSNSGDSNSGDSNSGNWNSGNWNSGNWNSGYRNSGNWNSGNWNSGNWNSGYRNSGNWNSGNRNSGDSNSGYRNSGAFCTDANPYLILFDKPTKIKVKDWEKTRACEIMNRLDTTVWVPWSIMNPSEKEKYPKNEVCQGYLKTISYKEAWSNMWGNMSDEDKKVFTDLKNFSWDKFTEITGIQKPKK